MCERLLFGGGRRGEEEEHEDARQWYESGNSALKWIHNYKSKDRMLEWKMVFPNNRSGQLKFTDVEKKVEIVIHRSHIFSSSKVHIDKKRSESKSYFLKKQETFVHWVEIPNFPNCFVISLLLV